MVHVDTDDLIDTQGVAEILGLAYRNTVLQYQQRYADMPRPVFDLGKGRVKLWLRSEITVWSDQQAGTGRSRPARRLPR
jgi:glutathione-regulated potassium-efflux system ancillary protein KefG